MKLLFSQLVIYIWPILISPGLLQHRQLVIWDVGQGLWVTAMTRRMCLHFDSGGEKHPAWIQLSNCHGKEHQHYLSHLDWDHMSELNWLSRQTSLCRQGAPLDRSRKRSFEHYLGIKSCRTPRSYVTELPIGTGHTKPNDLSRIFVYQNWALLPGDSTKAAEKYWIKNLTQKIRVLVLGHHGSNTSTGSPLLNSLPHLSLAIVSARKRKYGHPHPKVLSRLRKFGIPVLRTENWGNIILETPD